uniref:Uncharacterized protein n=1 Tax=Euplotes harpa TaxID=151035 RepID=A0A7S3JDX2_9SPIT|mmetsp:Transcript_35000/g.40444  ORF Transcript_35000/g.40444 Transcript_35000/m.40444 type:complete len:197 (+) Transcript_35000:500-1090(+)
MRYTLDQIRQADVSAVQTMVSDLGIDIEGRSDPAQRPFKELYSELIVSIAENKNRKKDKDLPQSVLAKLQEFSLDGGAERKPPLAEDSVAKLSMIEGILSQGKERDAQRELEEQQLKKEIEERDYKIYERINYKFTEKQYIHLWDLNPVGQKTIDAVNAELSRNHERTSDQRLPIDELEEIFNDWKMKKRYLRKYE